jgi:adenosylcobinamide-phosphate synthase
MSFGFDLALVTGALFIEAILGYPDILYRTFRHPVAWLGALIDWLEKRLNVASMPEGRRRLNGALALAFLLAAAVVPAALLQCALVQLLPKPAALIVLSFLASMFIAQVSLYRHVRDVADALAGGNVDSARHAVAKIVGRDTSNLDRAGIARAAVESLAENFSDGVVAPAFWGSVLGLPGMVAYKTVNTADSMIGHRNERFGAFGFAAAKFDDLINLPASRLSTIWIALAALFRRGASSHAALATALAFANRHRSPNAGWPEAAFAGALSFKLSGPRAYDGRMLDEPWIGDGNADLNASDIRAALSLYRIACAIEIGVFALLALTALA